MTTIEMLNEPILNNESVVSLNTDKTQLQTENKIMCSPCLMGICLVLYLVFSIILCILACALWGWCGVEDAIERL